MRRWRRCHRALASALGRERSAALGARRHRRRSLGRPAFRGDDSPWLARTRGGPRRGGGTRPPARRRAQIGHRSRCDAAPRSRRAWSSPPRPAIRSRRCAGPARARARWLSRCRRSGTRSATPSSPSCCTSWATASRASQDARRPAASRSRCAVSLHRRDGQARRSAVSNRLSPSTPRRRNWSAISRTVADVAPPGRAQSRTRPRLHHSCSRTRQGVSLGVYDLRRDEGWVSSGAPRLRERCVLAISPCRAMPRMRVPARGPRWSPRRRRQQRHPRSPLEVEPPRSPRNVLAVAVYHLPAATAGGTGSSIASSPHRHATLLT